MNKIVLLIVMACITAGCSDADQAIVPNVNVTGDDVTFKVPVQNSKVNINVSSSNSIIEIQKEQIIATLTVSGTSSIISIRTKTTVDNVVFTGTENKVLAEIVFDDENKQKFIPVTGETNGNELEYCPKDTAPGANGSCLPK